jgi:hypothetical protein
VRRGRKAAGLFKDEKIAGLPDKATLFFLREAAVVRWDKILSCPIFAETPKIPELRREPKCGGYNP